MKFEVDRITGSLAIGNLSEHCKGVKRRCGIANWHAAQGSCGITKMPHALIAAPCDCKRAKMSLFWPVVWPQSR